MTPWVRRLIIANVVVYFLQRTVPWVTGAFEFVPAYVLTQPWTIITYMFLHDPGGISHILFNMLALYFFGPRVEDRLGARRFFTLYFISGMFGALLSSILAPQSAIIGASAAVFGVMLGYATFWPRDLIYIFGIIPLEARWFVLGMTLFSLYSGMSGSLLGVADFAHLGGFAGAFLYLRWVDRTQGTKRFRAKAIADAPDQRLANWRKVDPRSVHEVNRDEVNRILDKISATGVGSLTLMERTFLANFVPLDDRKPPVS